MSSPIVKYVRFLTANASKKLFNFKCVKIMPLATELMLTVIPSLAE